MAYFPKAGYNDINTVIEIGTASTSLVINGLVLELHIFFRRVVERVWIVGNEPFWLWIPEYDGLVIQGLLFHFLSPNTEWNHDNPSS